VSGDPTPEEQVRALARGCVRSGLLSSEEMHTQVVAAITADLPDRAHEAEALAATWLEAAHDELRVDQRDWPESTDYERLQSAFAELELLDVTVLQGCEGEDSARRLVADSDAAGAGVRGVAWFTPSDVWRAVDEGRLKITVWPGSTAETDDTAKAADQLDDTDAGREIVADIVGVLEKHGLRSVSDERRIDVDAQWQRRIAT
jgi:hypothetical protein